MSLSRKPPGVADSPRVLGRGDMPVLVLLLLARRAHHGYELIKSMEDLSEGSYCPSPGSIYPVLARLESAGQVVAQSDGRARKVFALTAQGDAWLAGHQEAQRRVLARLAHAARHKAKARLPEEVTDAMNQLKTALFTLRDQWSDEVAHRVAAEIGSAARRVAACAPDPLKEISK